MNKQEYLDTEVIREFIKWIIPKISGEVRFSHQYVNSMDKTIWSCNSIYNAYENYNWKFSCTIPNVGKTSGHTFLESKEVLEVIQKGLKLSIQDNNHEKLLEYSFSVLKWGGVVRLNYARLEGMGKNIISYYKESIMRLNPETVNSYDDFTGIIMNSGFTKIYSLLISNFVIYDSRVGAALGLLVKMFLEEKKIARIPNELKFAYGNARPTKGDRGLLNRRNPSSQEYKFPILSNNDKKHIKNNIYASWLLMDISERSMFKHEFSPIRAIESSLFMIGYSVN